MNKLFYSTILVFLFTNIQSQSFERGPFTGMSITLPVVADFNADGKPDIVGVSRFFSPIGALKIHYSISEPDSLIFETVELGISVKGDPGVGDFDGDQDIDIIVIESENDQILILINNGDGSFDRKPLDSKVAFDFRAADFDGDNDVDIISFNSAENEAYLMTNDGNAGFTTSTIISEVDGFTTLDIADFDEDNDVDIIAAIEEGSEKIILLENQGNAVFTEKTITDSGISSLENLKIIDINKDGLMDVLFSSFFNSIVKGLVNNGDETFAPTDLAQALGGIRSFNVADYNNDGINDIIVGCNSDDNTYHQGLSNTTLEYDRETVSGIQPMFHIVNGDFDGDNDLDVILSNGDFWWLINKIDQGTVNTNDPNQDFFKISPNPFNEIIKIDIEHQEIEVVISDILGRTRFTSIEKSNVYDLQHLETGTYIISILDAKTKKIIQSSKIIKED